MRDDSHGGTVDPVAVFAFVSDADEVEGVALDPTVNFESGRFRHKVVGAPDAAQLGGRSLRGQTV